MKVFIDKLNIKGDKTIETNKLPSFREKIQNRELVDAGLLKEELVNYGVQTGDRVLPYLMQDVYTRNRDEIELKTVVLENENLKATFLTEFGMRLYSLYDKTRQRELLYVNPVLQIANLAIRKAWFSGGIEWNIGQLGHTFTTCEPMHVAKGVDEDGNEFIRTFEFERCKQLFWAIDFHLPKGSKQLAAYVKIINPKNEDVPMYWWTNAALNENNDVRIFSGNNNVIFIDETSNQGNNKGMAHGVIPNLKALPGKDSSYPTNYNYSCEYFFQNNKDIKETWEAAVYNDNTLYYERSSNQLPYRKMFCWGTHKGGKHWQEFLTEKGTMPYVELQAGLAPTQVHNIDMPANTEWDFVQLFGGCDIDYNSVTGEWNSAKDIVYKKVDECISAEQTELALEKYRALFLNANVAVISNGNGFGAVEAMMCNGKIPAGFNFAKDTITNAEKPWATLIETQKMNDADITELPLSYMVDLRYESLLLKAAKQGSFTAYNHLGIMYYEHGLTKKAENAFEASNEIAQNPLAYRNLYVIKADNNEADAIDFYKKAIELLGNKLTREYAEEYIAALCNSNLHKQAKLFFDSLPQEIAQGDRVQINMLEVAAKLEDLAFMQQAFKREFAVVREGERSISDYYFMYQAICEAKEKNIPLTKELIAKFKKENNLPYELDFRLSVV